MVYQDVQPSGNCDAACAHAVFACNNNANGGCKMTHKKTFTQCR